MRSSNAEPGDYPPSQYKIDPHEFTNADLGKLISLIRKNSGETEIDTFLRTNLSLLSFSSSFFSTGHHGTWVIPQPVIKPSGFTNGAGKIPDYLFAGDNSDGVTWWVIDLKSPQDSLYKEDKTGRIIETSKLTSSISQIRDYISYCTENQGFIRDTLGLKSFCSPYGVVIIGRESELKKDVRKQSYKAQFNRDSQTIQIRTFDAFLRQIEFFAHTAHKLNFLEKIYTSFFVRDEISPWDRCCSDSPED
jgi:hypothetical protein